LYKPGKGYRFIAPAVEPGGEKPAAQEPVRDPPPHGPATVAPVAIPQGLVADVAAAAGRPSTWRWALPVGIAVVLIAGLAGPLRGAEPIFIHPYCKALCIFAKTSCHLAIIASASF
jgi:hypothetical protein